MKFLINLDLFGKEPDLYYKGKTQINTVLGLVFTFIYISISLSYFLFKLIRMIKRKDVVFYDTYAYDKEIPSIAITNEEFYTAFTVGGIVDETIYHITGQYISGFKDGDDWNNTYNELEFEICKLEKFGSKHKDYFKDEPLNKSLCVKNIDLTLEGYSYLKKFSYINLQIRPCINHTKDGRPCKDYNTILKFFSSNYIEFKIQDNLLTPENYKNPVKPFQKDITCPIFLQLYQKIYAFIQIVRVETDEDILGVYYKPYYKLQEFTKYTESFVIAAPGSVNVLKTGEPVCDITLQLAADVLTQTRNYKTLLDVMGEAGGLMQFLYTFFNVILSFRIGEIYKKSLLNDLFSFNRNTKEIICKKIDVKKNIKDLESRDDQKLNFHQSDSKIYKEKSKQHRYIKSMINPLDIDINKDLDKKKKTNISDSAITHLEEKPEKYDIIDNIDKICLFFRCKSRNIQKVCFEEGMKLIEENLDITNLFINSYIIGKYRNKLPVNKYIPISEENRKYFSSIEEKINELKTSSESGVIK